MTSTEQNNPSRWKLDRPARIAVIGGGISGLSAALRLATARAGGAPVEEYLLEAAPRLGGVIFTDEVDGCTIEAGPDSFLTEKPQAAQLASRLGLGSDLVGSNDSERRTYILHRGRLVTLPDGLMFLIPTRLLPMATTPLVPLHEKIAMVRELFRKPRAVPEESVAAFVERHFGRGMVENIADPLLSGVYGGDSGQLSVQATLPRFVEMEQKTGSLIRAVLAARNNLRKGAPAGSPAPAPRPLFTTLKGGLSRLAAAVATRLDPSRVVCGAHAAELRPAGCGTNFAWTIAGDRIPSLEFDAVVLALPAHESARLLAPVAPAAASPLAQFPYSSSMTVVLGYPQRVRESLPAGFGFLVPRKERRRMLACTFIHAKFPDRVPPDRALVRCFLGGSRDPGVLDLDDKKVAEIVLAEIADILGLREPPLFIRVYRWHRSMAQYSLGHAARVAAVNSEIRKCAGLFLAGNWESGIGISDCIRSGETAATNALRAFEGDE